MKLPYIRISLFVIVAALVLLPTLFVAAQSLDYTANPNYGSVSLTSGFTPDPYSVNLTSGGSVSIASALGGSCRGYATSAPDFRISYTAGSFNMLSFYVTSEGDTTLVVLDADGDWYCDDDSGEGLNGQINIANPSSGTYDIWVGSFSSTSFVSATLNISELNSSGGNNPNNSNNNSNNNNSSTLNLSATPNYGSVALDSGFVPDPFEVDITSGGSISAAEAVSNSCRGYVTSAPDFRIDYDAGSFDNLYFYVEADDDTTLIINAADGDWYCDDDSGEGLNPLINIANPDSGIYDIWVGSYAEDEFISSTLFISEVGVSGSGNNSNNNSNNNTNSNSNTVDASRNPNYGSVALDSGFVPDPFEVDITSGGSISVAEAVSNSCRGYVTSAPDFRIDYDAGSFDNLYFYVEADDDTTLLVLDANGDFYCDDDSGEGLNPLINIANPSSGIYDIWVGSYAEDEFVDSTLFISEVGVSGSGNNSNNNNSNNNNSSNTTVGGLNFGLNPNYGSVSLTSGFVPDPFEVDITSGGSISAAEAVSNSCRGYVTSAPDFRVNYTEGAFDNLYFYVEANDDTTLLVLDPNGDFYCDDDSGEGLNPLINIANPDSGPYDIWVGSYASGEFIASTLFVSELTP
jgi:hypothetical protein